MRWGVVLCSCNQTLAVDPRRVGAYLGLAARPALFARLPKDEIHAFMDLVGRERFDRLVVGCCGPAELFREAVGAAGGDPAGVTVVDLRESCFWPHGVTPEAEAKAARLLRAAMRDTEQPERLPELSLPVGGTVVIATDSPAGFALARRIAAVGRPILVLDETSAAFDADPIHPLPWKASWGRIGRLDGTLGAFQVGVARTQPLSLEACIACRRCIPVCHTAAISEGLRLREALCDRCGDCLTACADVGAIKIPRQETETLRADQVVILGAAAAPAFPPRTGYYRLPDPDPAALDALAWEIAGRIGEFRRPDYVAYDADTCAGGAAGHESCGQCIPACPYGAITRNPRDRLRVLVDARACEGCGACVAVCPTSSLAFRDPAPADLRRRLAALVAPVPGEKPGAPRIVALHCPEEGQRALADAGRRRLPYPPSVLPLSLACLRQASEADLLAPFGLGAAGVALVGCEACPHGERSALTARLGRVRAVLDAFGLGADRVQLISGGPDDHAVMIATLDRFARTAGPPPVRGDGRAVPPAGQREAVTDVVRALLDATGREPGRIAVEPGGPFAVPEVKVADCTLSRACVNVCPTHAFRFDEPGQALLLKTLGCVACGLCVQACPEHAITLRDQLALERGALDWRVVVRDEPVRCVRCDKPFANRKALAAVEAKVLAIQALVDTFAGTRRRLLHMCPDCRAVAAMQEVDRGWEP